MKTKKLTKVIPFFAVVMMVLTACATEGTGKFSVVFPNQMGPYNSYKVSEERDPKQIVEFAMRLYDEGRYREAGHFFNEAANIPRLTSADNEFQISCYSAAAVSYLRAGDWDGFVAATKKIRKQMDRFQSVTAPETVEVLLALGDRYQGIQGDLPPDIPYQVSRLFRASSNGIK